MIPLFYLLSICVNNIQAGQTGDAFSVTCFGCKSQIPSGQLRNHHEIFVSNKDKQSPVEEHDAEVSTFSDTICMLS